MPAPLPAPALRRRWYVAGVLAALLLSACTGSDEPAPVRPVPTAVAPTASVTLPADPLLALVPRPDDVPSGLLPVVAGSGPRDLAAVAAFSGDPAAAATALRAHGFSAAYVAQYAEQLSAGARGRVLSVVVSRFATLKGAADDLAGDVAASGTGERADVGSGASLRVQPLPGGAGQLTTLRFRVGTRT
ncbi:MAG: hypothetical protein JWM64_1796, partial [Frankiales bacterium]|nr:hypothetical protein [Frankiales bacterium]